MNDHKSFSTALVTLFASVQIRVKHSRWIQGAGDPDLMSHYSHRAQVHTAAEMPGTGFLFGADCLCKLFEQKTSVRSLYVQHPAW